MTENPQEAEETSEPKATASDSKPTPAGGKNALGVVVVFLIAIAIGGWAGYVWVNSDDEFDWRRFAFMGEREYDFVAVTGNVIFNGEPLTTGYVEAHPLDTSVKPDRMIGPIQPDGSFEMFSDFGGTLSEGLPVGEYKVLLIVFHPTAPLEPAVRILPNEYYEVQNTPLRMTVTSDPAKNVVTLEGNGELQPKVRPPAADRSQNGDAGEDASDSDEEQ